jgi:hypothetical protein
MPITTIKRCQVHPKYWHTVEDCNVEIENNPRTGPVVKYHEDGNVDGTIMLSVGFEDALLIRDAINQLYPSSRILT